MKFLSTLMTGLLFAIPALAADNIAGVYKTVDDETGEAKSLVQIYPHQGKIYGCEMWREGNKLIVRGKIGPFGRNQTWIFENAGKGEALTPVIPVRK